MVRWQDLTWPEVGQTVFEMPFALLPFGAIEEHGPHLPLGTDTLAAESLASLICEAAGVIELPVMPYGQVWSLEHFDGSLSVSDDTLISLVLELAQGLERVGVKGIVLLSAHLGNAAPLKKASRALEESGGIPALVLIYPGLSEVAREVREAPESHPGIMHADELETSIMLALHPNQVRMDEAVAEYPEYPSHFDVAAVRWNTVSDSGVFGDATAATPAKGKLLVSRVVGTAASLISDWKKVVL